MNAYKQPSAELHHPTPVEVDLATEVFQMLADGTRFRLLLALVDDELPVNDLSQVADKPLAGVSQHLAKLRLARLAGHPPRGTPGFYRLENGHVRQLIVDALNHAEHMGPSMPRHHRQQALPLSRQTTGD